LIVTVHNSDFVLSPALSTHLETKC